MDFHVFKRWQIEASQSAQPAAGSRQAAAPLRL
jgi:hypothetical protein